VDVGEPCIIDLNRIVIKENVVPLDKERPVGSEHPFQSNTHVGATGVAIHAAKQQVGAGVKHPGPLLHGAPSTLGVAQRRRGDQEAKAGCDRREPARIVVKRKVRIDGAKPPTPEISRIDHALNAKQPVRRKLIVATDLPATSKATPGTTTVVKATGIIKAH